MDLTTLYIAAVLFVVIVTVRAVRRSRSGGELDSYYDSSDGDRYPHRWGYTDTRFEFDGPRSVRVTGDRYPLAGYSLPHLVPFVEEVLGVPIRQEDIALERSTRHADSAGR